MVETATNDVAVASAQVASLEHSLGSAEHDAAGENMARVKLKSLEANATSTQSMYEAFVARLRADSGHYGRPNARCAGHFAGRHSRGARRAT